MAITLDGSNYVWSFYRDNSNKNFFYFDLDNSGTYVLVAYGNLDSSGSKIFIHALTIKTEIYWLFFCIALLKHTFRDITTNAVVIDPVATTSPKTSTTATTKTTTKTSTKTTTIPTITTKTTTLTTTKTAATTPSPAKDKSKLKAHGI